MKKNQLVKTNQKQGIRCRCGSIKHLQITSNDFPVGISCRKAKNWPLEMRISLSETNKSVEDEEAEE